MAVNATGAGVCLLLERTGHDTGTLNMLANLSLAISLLVLLVTAIHELIQGRAELLRGTVKGRTVTEYLSNQAKQAAEAVSEERSETWQSSDSVPVLARLDRR